MSEDVVEAGKSEPSGAVQAATALLLIGGTVAGLWGFGVLGNASANGNEPAACPAPKQSDAAEYPALCAALNRPDLPTLVGMPTERVSVAQSGGGPVTYADGTKEDVPAAEVQIGQVRVRITDNRTLTVDDAAFFTSSPPVRTQVLDHSARTFTDHTMAISFGLTGGKASAGTGGIARHLVVAKAPGALGGGSFELAIWRQDSADPDEAALFRMAEQILPELRTWVTGP
ncbi:DUF6215 domain-containing protein [Kitasatospora sp. NBC_01560]|uniref:DUF6215 domain-containing protein n=1 Tax=Kitasatospora sp. NBC_01560 TaxID=2975965 RepID=UPI00386BA2C2